MKRSGGRAPGRLISAMRQRCPRCREGAVFRRWVTMHEKCPGCALVFEREPGYFMGSMYISYFLGVPVVGCLALLVRLMLPQWPLEWILVAAFLLSLPFSVSIFRYSRVLWLYLDRTLDPD